MMVNWGFVYAVYGPAAYFDEAHISVSSLRAQMPDTHITAYVYESQSELLNADLFDEVVTISVDPGALTGLSKHFDAKITAIRHNRYEAFVYLDTDTFICGDLAPLFDLLERFDVLAAHAPVRRRFRFENYVTPDFVSDAPEPFCELNTGVLGFRRTKGVAALLEFWEAAYKSRSKSGDQYLFMDCIYKSEVGLYVLPSEYNFRSVMPQYAYGKIHIVHGRHPNIADAAAALNASAGMRVSWPAPDGIVLHTDSSGDAETPSSAGSEASGEGEGEGA